MEISRKNGRGVDKAYPKALANLIFRETIEDVHTRHNISQKNMQTMNRQAANRAKVSFDHVMNDGKMLEAFAVEAIMVPEWDEPEQTDEEIRRIETYRDIAENIEYKEKSKSTKEEKE